MLHKRQTMTIPVARRFRFWKTCATYECPEIDRSERVVTYMRFSG